MATSQGKRSTHRAQPAHSSVTTPTTRRVRISIPRQKVFQFPEVKGKVLEGAEFVTSSDYNAISFCFQDKTALDLVIDISSVGILQLRARKRQEGWFLDALRSG